MPFNSSAPVMYYDKNAFKEVGLDPDKPPQTYDEVFAAAQKLVKKDASGKIIRSGVDFTLYGWILEQELATQGALFADPNNGRAGPRHQAGLQQRRRRQLAELPQEAARRGRGPQRGPRQRHDQRHDAGRQLLKGDAAMAFESIATLRGWSSQAKAAAAKSISAWPTCRKPAGAPGGVIIGGASLWITDQGTADQQAGRLGLRQVHLERPRCRPSSPPTPATTRRARRPTTSRR